ncbi:peptide ABC transporter [candidate division WOR-1 bacterium DG_54_3]|uniref:Peptide ABC transporter n=1 Tax=candidate division WOR-1 bacterium DG_54_3 TaxID=1703775 RepID=A0A0S7Y0U3_UNCSA|nr:MAG: peptide ABC transporter [candidate division WOR-1 bacterium DG_54_3]
MRLGPFILRRLAISIFVLFGLSILIFLIARIVPGDPARMALGPRAPVDVVERLRQQMHLDKPLLQQYGLWLWEVVHGNLGDSLVTRRPVKQDIREFFPATLELVGLTAIFIAVAGISLGVISARYSNTWFDNVVRLFSYLGIVTPAFAWAVILMLLFGFVWHLFPTYGRLTEGVIPPSTITGMYTVDSLLNGRFDLFCDAVVHLILPAIALALPPMSQAARITRSSMADNQNKDCIASMIAYGVPNRIVTGKYLLKPSLISPITVMALDIAATFGYAFMVEKIFGFPGMARYGIQVMLNKDVNAIVGVVMVLGVVFITLNIVVDIIVAYLDPRIRLLGRSV